MSTTATAPAASETEPTRIRERSDVHRQIRLVVTFAIATALCLYFAIAVDDPNVRYILGERVTKEFQPKDLNGSWVSWVAFAVAALALVLAAVNRFPRGAAGVLIGILVGLLWAAGLPAKWFVGMGAIAVAGVAFLAADSANRMARIQTWIGGEALLTLLGNIVAVTSMAEESRLCGGLNKVMSPVADGIPRIGQALRRT